MARPLCRAWRCGPDVGSRAEIRLLLLLATGDRPVRAEGADFAAIGIPLTREGRQRKLGAALGCCVPLALIVAGPLLLAVVVRAML